jgi:ribonuclease HI
MSIQLFFDGASKGNPGLSGCGYFIKYIDGSRTPYSGFKFLGIRTNNEAEYYGLIYALEIIIDKDQEIEVMCI